MEITEKWLGEIAGWAVMKAARSLVAGGQVQVTRVEPDLVQGLSGTGRMQFRAGLKIHSRSHVDNLCTCPTARRTGAMCEHSIAVGLLSLQPKGAVKAATPASKQAAPTAAIPKPKKEAPAIKGRFSIYLPEGLRTGAVRFPAGVFLKFEPASETETPALSEWLAQQGIGPQTVPLSLQGSGWTDFLRALAGHPRVFAGKPSAPTPVHVADTPQSLPVSVEAIGGGEVVFERMDQDWVQASPTGGWWLCKPTGTLFSVPHTEGSEGRKLLNELVTHRRAVRPLRWWVKNREAVGESLQVQPKGREMSRFHVVPVPAKFEFEVDGSLQHAIVRAKVRHGDVKWSLAGKDPVDESNQSLFPIQDESSASAFYVRNEAAERRILDVLEDLDFTLDASGEWRLSGQNKVLGFFGSGIPRLGKLGSMEFTQRWRAATRGLERVAPLVRQAGGPDDTAAGGGRSGMDWLSMEFRYEAADGFRLPRNEVLRLVRSGQSSVPGRQGKRYVIHTEAIESFEDSLQDVPLEITPEGARVHAWHAHAMSGVEAGSFSESGASPLDEGELKSRLGDLAETLRPYQAAGVRWLEALARAGQGGILADDMGLGKTLQSIALLRAVGAPHAKAQSREDPGGPALVVCPKSLLGNWKAEFERFAPEFRVGIHHGSDRESVADSSQANDVILTTYSLIARDLKYFIAVSFGCVLLDEASYIRNPDTAAAKALRQIQAKARFALTGTPIENSVRDLWSILNFALPGYLGDRDHFKERFETPLAAGVGSAAGRAASERLKRLIQPFFLRRTKGEVLRELPEKIEQVLWCDPTPAQAQLYSKLLDEGRDEIRAAQKRAGAGGARMTMFTVLLRLRQVCCDLRLTGLPESALSGLEPDDLSAKWSVWRDRLEQILASDGKVLIFSQFVSFLRLLRNNLEDLNINYCYLDGSTSNRQAEVDRFQKDPEQRVFLISLKAGGYGLNLTAADHVFLMDPWWNPAVESQAIDRAHRMGQTKVVNAYRFATRGTVEERILRLQEKKRGLVEAALVEDGAWAEGVGDEELAELLGV